MAGAQPGTSGENQGIGQAKRKILVSAVGALVQEAGFHFAEKAAIGTLTEILQSCK